MEFLQIVHIFAAKIEITMTTLTIQVKDSSLLSGLKKILKAIDGVTIVSSKKECKSSIEQPNETTLKAIEDVKAGKTFKASSADDLIAQCLK